MKTWEDYKNNAKSINESTKNNIEEMEILAAIVSAIIEKRNKLGITQRELAKICGIPHSSVARIEACSVKPKIDTLIKIMTLIILQMKALMYQIEFLVI